MKVFTGTNATQFDTLIQTPCNMLIGCVTAPYSGAGVADVKAAVQKFLNASTCTITLIDNYKSVQEVMATKIPLSFFNDLSSMGEGAVVHSVVSAATESAAGTVKIMFKIPIAYVGSLDLNSQKYLNIGFDFTQSMSYGISSVAQLELFARQGRALTNELIQYKRLNVPDGVLTYEFVPDGPAYVTVGQTGGTSSANIDFVEIAYNTGVTSRIDFFELLAKYYEDNEVSARFIAAGTVSDTLFESTILALESVGVKSIRIVRNNTQNDTTIICLSKYVSSATDNRISNGNVTKLVTGEYVPKANRAEMELITVLEPLKSYAVSETIKTAVAEAEVSPAGGGNTIAGVYAQMR